MPGLDPDQSLVKHLVDNFILKVSEITEKQKEASSQEDPAKNNENSVAKLFEEVKIMFDSLPLKIENRIDPDRNRKRRRFHPLMIEEMTHFGVMNENPSLGLMIILGFYKDEYPWFYEIGIDSIKELKKAKTITEKSKIVKNFEWAIETLNHPMIREYYGDSKDLYILKESRHSLMKMMERLAFDKNL